MSNVQRYLDTIEDPTLILVDMAFFAMEFQRGRAFYADLYSDANPNEPRKEISSRIDPKLMLKALCKYGNARERISSLVVFVPSGAQEIFTAQDRGTIKLVDCPGPIWVEMGKVIALHPTTKRVIIVADDRNYVPLINMLLTKEYNICLIKHKQEEDSDWSHMPAELPYQFSYYVVGECLGLVRSEL